MSELITRLSQGPLLLDGAFGTELERRGVDTTGPSWTSRAIIDHPELIITIHLEYIESGADIITANSFRTNPRAHRHTGLDAETLTKRAVHLAKEAIDRSGRKDVLIAGSIAPANDSLPPQQVEIDDRMLLDEHSMMSSWLAEAGADLILIETMNTVREAFIALAGARRSTSLPIAVALVPASAKHLISGASLDASVQLLASAGADVPLLNCNSLTVIGAALTSFALMCKANGIKWGVYPNASEIVGGKWEAIAHDDSDFVSFARQAADAGASIIGSCCGTTPSTTARMASEMTKRAVTGS